MKQGWAHSIYRFSFDPYYAMTLAAALLAYMYVQGYHQSVLSARVTWSEQVTVTRDARYASVPSPMLTRAAHGLRASSVLIEPMAPRHDTALRS